MTLTWFHPFAYVSFAMVITFIYIVIRSKASLQDFVTAINSINTPIIAIVVMALGCMMYLLSKQYGLEVSVPSGIVGAGIGLLTGKAMEQAKQEAPKPPPILLNGEEVKPPEPPKPPTP